MAEQTGPPGDNQKSWITILVEKNATGVLVSILFIITIICFTTIVFKVNSLSEHLITVFASILSGLIGFFAGSKSK
jgi:hypothetical protein